MNRMINRSLTVAVTVAAVVLAAPSFARPDSRLSQQDSSPALAVGGGAPEPGALAPGAAPADATSVTGEVVMSTPTELVLHTANGMQRFTITPETQALAGTAEGDTVTVYYKPAEGAASATSIEKPGVPVGENQIAPSADTGTEAAAAPSVQEGDSPEPSVQQPAATDDESKASPPATSEPQLSTAGQATPSVTTTQRITRLPKTASEMPLIGLVGALALGGALLLRAIRI